jgi:branched-chain amino acid transport system substrate-binding protein
MNTRYFPYILLFILCLVLEGVFCTASLPAAKPHHLGVALGLTGTGAPYSKDGLDAIKLAVNEINAQGGILGKHPIRLFIRDTQTNPEIAVSAAQDLIEKDRVRCIIGTYSSACAMAIKPICLKSKVLHITTISNSEDITKIQFSPYTYSVVPNTYMQAKAVALGVAKLVKERGWVTYCTIASDYPWGRSAQRLTVKFLKQLVPHLKLIRAYWPPLGETKFTGFVMGIYAYRPDCLIGCIAGTDNTAWMSEARNHELFQHIPYPGSLISVTELIQQAKTLERGMIGLARAPFFAHMDIPMMAHFVKNFRAKYSRYPSDWAVMSYDGVHILKQGFEMAGDIETTGRAALRGRTVDTCRGKLFFREIDNQLSCSSYMGVVTDDPDYPFPIYGNLIEIKGPDSWRPKDEILKARVKVPR